jgi:5S rRNA maturation endonuclease (ribonuclease M5)
MHQNQPDFRYIREHVSIDQVLSRYGIQLRPAGAGNLRGRCPLPTHTSRVSTASFSVNLHRNVWSCQSASCIAARGGQIGGNVLDLVAALERCSIREAGVHLAEWFAANLSDPMRTPIAAAQNPSAGIVAETNPPLTFVLRNVDPWHPYLAKRGIQIDTAKMFGVGFYSGDGFLSGRIVIPIHDHAGQLIAYAGRSLAGEEPKYRLPAGFRKSQVLFNLHRASSSGEKKAIVVEGFFDAMKIHQAGHTNVVALMGSSFSQRQSDLLAAHFTSATLMLDGDPAGRHAADVIQSALVSRMPVTRIDVAHGRQPDQMQPVEIRALLGPGRQRTHSMER